jgi:Family of unknown function (DUF5367)
MPYFLGTLPANCSPCTDRKAQQEWCELNFSTCRLAAIVLVAPGMLLDTISAAWFGSIFPNIRPDAAGLFGGWLLFCNVVVLLTAISTGSEERLDRGGSVIEDPQ